MASSPFNAKSRHHARSNSFPTRTRPLISEFNEQLSRLRDSEEPSSSSTSISKNLNGLQDLHECVDKLLLFPFSQAVAREQQEKWVNELLDGSLRLLDVGNVARDALLQTKEKILEFQSTLRRRRGSRMELAKEVEKYLTCRKVVKKAMQKASKRMQSNFKQKNNDSLPIVTMLKEVEKTTILAFESLLTFMVGTKLQSKSSSWSLVSKLVHPKRVTCEDEEANEFEKLDAALQSLINHKTSQSDSTEQVENVQDCLGELESSIQNFEEALEHLSRRLVKTRVSLLNIFNH